MYINPDPVMALIYFRDMSTWVTYVFEWVKVLKLLKCHLKGKTCRELANGQDIDYSEKTNGPRASSSPLLGLSNMFIGICTADLR